MKNRFYYYQLLDEREEQLFNKAGSESFYICIALSLLSYIIYLPWIFIGNLGLKSYGEWAQKKFEQDMDELESGE
ncbi:Uncharacterised protein [Streptococcus pneumoniae]|nr:Uncharacterised protein [Streptococcus pneumoniae]VRD07111.1 Uncharacterised protein [Streptococcus pneumoniae]VSN36875.1 Uncharacterised protein [Streptococcus pneumoniae]